MNNNFTLQEQEELFTSECKLINLKYEYNGYNGNEKFAIVTELTEEKLKAKYPDVISRYLPFVLLSTDQGEVIDEFNRVEDKHKKRAVRYGHYYDVNDSDFLEHHPEFAYEEDLIEKICTQEKIESIRDLIETELSATQKSRFIKFFFEEKTYTEISKDEGVSVSSVKESIELGIKKLKKFLK